MTRDTFDMFSPAERGRFGDNGIRGNESVRSNLTDVTVVLRKIKPLAIAVSRDHGANAKWIWLPKSAIEFRELGKGFVEVTLPEGLAREKGLI